MALNQQRCCYCSSRPPARANGHLVEPLLEGKLADSSSLGPTEHVVHVHGDVVSLPERAVSGSDFLARSKVDLVAPNKERSVRSGTIIERDVSCIKVASSLLHKTIMHKLNHLDIGA